MKKIAYFLVLAALLALHIFTRQDAPVSEQSAPASQSGVAEQSSVAAQSSTAAQDFGSVASEAAQNAGRATQNAGEAADEVKQQDDYDLIQYTGHLVSFNTETLIPNWVYYELVKSETNGDNTREGKNFRKDPDLQRPQAEDDDYRNSGWSRGHMAPAGDFKWSDKAMTETFYFTNCCPQNQSLNAGQWSTLEKKVRNWAKKYGKVLVVTGPIIGENIYGTIGDNNVVVPDAFFKAVVAGDQSIAFVMYNRPENENMQKCAMTVDELEKLSGYDFFSELDDEFENRVEASYKLSYWGL